MPDLLGGVASVEGLPWLILAAFVAGTVRGFSGFGTALIYLPLAGRFIDPIWAILTLAVMDMFGPLPNAPSAWRNGHPRDVMRLWAGTLVALPIGLMVLYAVDPAVFRYGVSFLALGMLAALVLGLRYQGTVTRPMVYGIGGAAGFLGGAAGLPGPPVILFYMASPHGARVVRANTMIYLLGYDVLLMGVLALQDRLTLTPVLLGVALAVPNILGNLLGARIFDPARETLYRWVAYAMIAASAIGGLPFLSGGH
ncbi:sulfite exporter TauE/SafE family protein [Shimia sp. FJ5]|uniref:sulfite exporter TauE/SafE family protein n=1 Tax=Shimia sp. FJ5 TaxID=3079054 RepID=UPI00262034C7|nr:sulfite exporter TauE/SafE family protein [Shimia sp. FJ5]MDV4145533.1 sulfite exporter TauE/SafE family protein [Shimia sp. FJ5]